MDESVIRADPNRTLIPGMIVDAVVVEPWGAIPPTPRATTTATTTSTWPGRTSRATPRKLERYLDEFVHGVRDRAGYLAKVPGLTSRLKAKDQYCEGVNYGF